MGRHHGGAVINILATLMMLEIAAAAAFAGYVILTQRISRLMTDLVEPKHLEASRSLVRLLAAYNEVEDLVNIGAYSPGSNPEVDLAVASRQDVLGFLRQDIQEAVRYDEARSGLDALTRKLEQSRKTILARRTAQAAVAAKA